jgi:hypothetical protein
MNQQNLKKKLQKHIQYIVMERQSIIIQKRIQNVMKAMQLVQQEQRQAV